MKIAIIGTGYVGLTSGAGFAEFGNDVVCADIAESKIAALRARKIPFHEPDLPDLVTRNIEAGRLRFTTDLSEAIPGAEVVFLAVGTPEGPGGQADLSQVLRAAESVGRALDRDGVVIVTKSTVPVGTTEKVRDVVAGVTRHSFHIANNPEFLKEGDAVRDFLRPDRVVLGVADEPAAHRLRSLYGPFVRDPGQILVMDIRSSELTKYASNAMLAVRISYMNDLAALCEQVGADIHPVRLGVGMDSRIGDRFLYAGIGYGGSCFPKDVKALVQTARQHGCHLSLVEAAQAVNERQAQRFFNKIRRHFLGGPLPELSRLDDLPELQGKTVAIWGLAFKPDTDDVREAPALALIRLLLAAGVEVRATDPAALGTAQQALSDRGPNLPPMTYCTDPYEAARGAEALVLVTEWRAFRQPDWARLGEVMAGRVLFDGRNVWDRAAAQAAGFVCYGVGR